MKKRRPPLNADTDAAEKEKEKKDDKRSEKLQSDEDGHISPTFAPLSPVEVADEPGVILRKKRVLLFYSLDSVYGKHYGAVRFQKMINECVNF